MSKTVLGEDFQSSVEDIVAAAMIEAVKLLWGLDGDKITELVAQRIIDGPLETFDD